MLWAAIPFPSGLLELPRSAKPLCSLAPLSFGITVTYGMVDYGNLFGGGRQIVLFLLFDSLFIQMVGSTALLMSAFGPVKCDSKSSTAGSYCSYPIIFCINTLPKLPGTHGMTEQWILRCFRDLLGRPSRQGRAAAAPSGPARPGSLLQETLVRRGHARPIRLQHRCCFPLW